ncbi:hypothetical protein BDZ89DRAFT_1066991 [Hymenopellis radicata]|nr:hypothetical protein BDZ89DRAFT_1066991 [Hymenopellis radicata]
MATIQSRLWTFRPWDLLPPPLFSRFNPFDMDAAHNGAALVAIPAAPTLAEISSTMANGLDKPQEHLPAKCATTKELDSFASVKLHPESRLFRISRGGVSAEQKHLPTAQLDAIQKADPNVQSAVVGDSEAPSNGTHECIIPAVDDESSIHVCQFIALVVFTTLNKSASANRIC